jgi:hypothetical protein
MSLLVAVDTQARFGYFPENLLKSAGWRSGSYGAFFLKRKLL